MSSTDPAAAPSWQAWESALTDAVLALPDGASLTVTPGEEHARKGRPRGARVRFLVSTRRRPVLPGVRLVRVEDHLRGHFAGAERWGGPFPWSREEEDAIIVLGWHRPTVADGDDFIRFWPDDVPQGPYLPLEDARRAAAAVALTFAEVLAVTPDGAQPDGGLPAVRHDEG